MALEVPLAVPHTPLTAAAGLVAVQFPEFVPPPEPRQVQVTEFPAEGKVGLAGEAVPAEQRVYAPKDVSVEAYVLLAEPQEPLTTAQLAVYP